MNMRGRVCVILDSVARWSRPIHTEKRIVKYTCNSQLPYTEDLGMILNFLCFLGLMGVVKVYLYGCVSNLPVLPD